MQGRLADRKLQGGEVQRRAACGGVVVDGGGRAQQGKRPLVLGGVTRLYVGMDVARVSMAVESRFGLEYEPLRVISSSRSLPVSVLVSVTLNHNNNGKGEKEVPGQDAP